MLFSSVGRVDIPCTEALSLLWWPRFESRPGALCCVPLPLSLILFPIYLQLFYQQRSNVILLCTWFQVFLNIDNLTNFTSSWLMTSVWLSITALKGYSFVSLIHGLMVSVVRNAQFHSFPKLAEVWCLDLCAETPFVLLLKFGAVLSIACCFLMAVSCWRRILQCIVIVRSFLRLLKLHKLAVCKLDFSKGAVLFGVMVC